MENLHHVVFPRASYRSPLERQFRTHRRLIILLDELVHVELHEHIRAVDKPSTYQMMGAIAVLDNLSTASPVEVMEELAAHMSGNGNLVAHYLRQIPYIERGYDKS